MEKVFSVEKIVPSPSSKTDLGRGARRSEAVGEGRVESVLGSGLFVVVLESGQKIQVRGEKALKVGSQVQVLLPNGEKIADKSSALKELSSSSNSESGFQWSAFIPLGFGGKNAVARLEVFVEERTKGAWEKTTPATYFVLTVQTEKYGEIQWSIYIKGRQVAVQVYAKDEEVRKGLSELIEEIEGALKGRGFGMVAPTAILGRPFRVPAGFRLNLKG
jgi:hypothetical protein